MGTFTIITIFVTNTFTVRGLHDIIRIYKQHPQWNRYWHKGLIFLMHLPLTGIHTELILTENGIRYYWLENDTEPPWNTAGIMISWYLNYTQWNITEGKAAEIKKKLKKSTFACRDDTLLLPWILPQQLQAVWPTRRASPMRWGGLLAPVILSQGRMVSGDVVKAKTRQQGGRQGVRHVACVLLIPGSRFTPPGGFTCLAWSISENS